MTIKLTELQRAVLDHVVLDADDWVTDALRGRLTILMRSAPEGTRPESLMPRVEVLVNSDLKAKVARWTPHYEQALASEGGSYRNRRARDIESLRKQLADPKMATMQESLRTQIDHLERRVKPIRISELREQRRLAAARQ